MQVKPIKNKLFDCYFYLFFFIMMNREYSPFGLDLRVPVACLGVLLFLWAIKDFICRKKRLKLQAIDGYMITFFILSFLSNVMWFYNGLSLHSREFLIIFVSYAFNFLSYFIFLFYKESITINKLKRAMLFSTLVLLFSIIMAFIGVDLPKYLMSGCKGFVEDLSPNFIGGIYRYGGYAEDPNYASLFFVFAIATYIYCQRKLQKNDNIIYISLFLFGFLLSASKTTLLAVIAAALLLLFRNIKWIKIIWIPMIMLVPILLVAIQCNWFDSMITMMQRFKMWDFSLELFKQSPIIGNGFTAFRSYADMIGWWYVQSHSTIFQMLSETGFVSLVLFGVILTMSLLKNSKYLTFMIALFSIYMITTETAYHVYFIFILAILPIIVEECERWKKPQSLS